MSTAPATTEQFTVTTAPMGSAPFIWTLERYHRAIELGVLTPNDPVELLFGQLIPKLPVEEPHTECLSQLFETFYDRFGKQYKYRGQDPVTLPNHSEPEPDFVVAKRMAYSKATGHPGPGEVYLLIEISARTLLYDRGDKLRSYALAGIQEYWIINLEHRQVEVHLGPNEQAGDYGQTSIYRNGQSFESPFGGTFTVDELLPPE